MRSQVALLDCFIHVLLVALFVFLQLMKAVQVRGASDLKAFLHSRLSYSLHLSLNSAMDHILVAEIETFAPESPPLATVNMIELLMRAVPMGG